MKRETILAQYRAWLTHREYSPATIQKYTHALARFFADTGAGESPARETVAAWRDALSAKGYTPATVNAMLAAVNDYQESVGNPLGKARPLKKQHRVAPLEMRLKDLDGVHARPSLFMFRKSNFARRPQVVFQLAVEGFGGGVGGGGVRRRRCSPGRGRTPGSRRPSGPRYRAFARRARGAQAAAAANSAVPAPRPRQSAETCSSSRSMYSPCAPQGCAAGRGKALELRAAERRAHKAARGERAAQPGRQRGDVGGGPVVDERVGSDGPAAVFPPPAVDHHLAAYKARKQRGGRLGGAQVGGR